MNIKHVEQLTGITSKNIRFYEDAGLLHPKRNESNSYREYCDEDVRSVKLIKMLRKLDIPIETIREVLSGQQPLDAVMSQQYGHLEQSIRQMEAAKQICRSLETEQVDIDKLDVDGYLDRIDTLEKQGERFSNIVDDFKTVVTALEKRKLTIVPNDVSIITTPREFTDALLQYAKDYGRDITITRESMSPKFILDGIPYTAVHVMSRYGDVIYADVDNPDLLDTPDVPPQRRRWIEIVWKYVIPISFWGALFLFLLRGYIF